MRLRIPIAGRALALDNTFSHRCGSLPRRELRLQAAKAQVQAAGPGPIGRPTAQVTGERMRQPVPKWLRSPANIGACATGIIMVQDAGPGPGHLTRYMSLPVEEYVVLEGANIERLGNNLFRLSIPRIEFFDVWLEPELEVTVLLEEGKGSTPKVVMQSQKTVIRGSEWIEQFNINEKFASVFRAELKWQASSAPGGGPGKLMVKTGTEVYCEVFPPFNVIPKPTLESSCNAVLSSFVPALLKLFLSKLADDYGRWSSDPEYRARRKSNAETIRQVSQASAN